MCGRFTLRTPASVLIQQFELPPGLELEPRYNIAPTQLVAAVRAVTDCAVPDRVGTEKHPRELAMLRWGLIPAWSKDATSSHQPINARGDTVASKPSFRAAFRRRRCLVLADGFYEWQRTGKQKLPYWITLRDKSPFAIAGLWEAWERDGQRIESCTLITTDANQDVSAIHDRMPVILPTEAQARWLDPTCDQPDALQPLLVPYADGQIQLTPVSTWVNSPTHEGPRCLEPQV